MPSPTNGCETTDSSAIAFRPTWVLRPWSAASGASYATWRSLLRKTDRMFPKILTEIKINELRLGKCEPTAGPVAVRAEVAIQRFAMVSS